MKLPLIDSSVYESVPQLLLIDDDMDDLEMLSAALEKLGVRTKSCSSGDKALVYLKLMTDTAELPVLIISDFNMPKLDGGQLLNKLKSNLDFSDIPVLMYSTGLSDVCEQALIGFGAESCHTKPFRYAEFISKVQLFKDRLDQLSMPVA